MRDFSKYPLSEKELKERLASFVPHSVQWFPGHMAKTRRELSRLVSLANVIIEVVDARIPQSGRYRDLSSIIRNRTHVIALTKVDLSDSAATKNWIEHLRTPSRPIFPIDAQRGRGVRTLLNNIKRMHRPVRALVVGVPNSGKSSLINRVCFRAAARVGARPGVTRGPQWLRADRETQFLDTPGLLWPRIEDPLQGLKLAWTGSVGENAYDAHDVGSALALWLVHYHPDLLAARYGLTDQDMTADPETILRHVGRRLGYLMAGGAVNTAEAARALLADFRLGRLGRITLDDPPCKSDRKD
ncbi:MAG: ribosome biogenesis GTPase YlqF [Firmicutes bacterium]|nr:ribosome biogenesis GTPase YlqF [Bacillota bacterium]